MAPLSERDDIFRDECANSRERVTNNNLFDLMSPTIKRLNRALSRAHRGRGHTRCGRPPPPKLRPRCVGRDTAVGFLARGALRSVWCRSSSVFEPVLSVCLCVPAPPGVFEPVL